MARNFLFHGYDFCAVAILSVGDILLDIIKMRIYKKNYSEHSV
jgi:hypothetical protein